MNPGFSLLIISIGWDQGLRERRGSGGLLKSGSGHHDEVAEREEMLIFFPGFDLYEGISAQDKKEDGALMPLPEISDRVDGVRFSRSPKLNVRSREIRICLNGPFHHFEAVMGCNDLFCHLMRGKGCRNEDHFLKAKSLSNLFRSAEVTQMDGIECPPK
jgi:hypothetical protein